ncbi:MAG: glycosyltransferase family 39 protein [Planctomycetaceae bacterium]|jgi:hypothetical protein|nr:glycosyltransferase family 39 protein [Planctomycetaceae bacterium]
MMKTYLRLRLSYILFLFFVQAVIFIYVSWSTSPNRTEIGHLGASAYFWQTGKFDVFHVNPPLLRVVSGIPVFLFCNPKIDLKNYSPRPQDRCEWRLGNSFVTVNSSDDVRFYVFLSRLVCLPFLFLGSYFGYRFALELFGDAAGLLFLHIWIFSPMIIGWGATICPDVAAASVGIAALYFFWHWLRNPSTFGTIPVGVMLGLMILTKLTWIIAPLIWFILWVICRFSRYSKTDNTANFVPIKVTADGAASSGCCQVDGQKSKQLTASNNRVKPTFFKFLLILFVALYMVNFGYLFDGSFKLLKNYQFISGSLTNNKIQKHGNLQQGNRFKDSILGYIPVPFPAEFIQGIDTQKLDFERGMDSYLCGVWSERGFFWYYFYVLFLKEPLGTLGLAFLSFVFLCTTRVWSICATFITKKNLNTSCPNKTTHNGNSNIAENRVTFFDELVILIPMFVVMLFISCQTGFSLHPRYIVLVLPMFYIFAAGAVRGILFGSFWQGNLCGVVWRIAILSISILLMLSSVVSSLREIPYSMSYFNELTGRGDERKFNAPEFLLGSCIDWGQDMYELSDWIKKHPEAKPLYISYTPSIPLATFGIKYDGFVTDKIQNGWAIIGINNLYEKSNQNEKYKKIKPTTTIGWSIRIYHLETNTTHNQPHNSR